jgi:hypothetical protein
MSALTKEQLLGYYDRVAEPAELTEFAAADAARELATNWQAAIRDGQSIESLLGDVDKTILILQVWKFRLAHHLAE